MAAMKKRNKKEKMKKKLNKGVTINVKYQSSSPWLVVIAMTIISFIIGYCLYWDFIIDEILFNDTFLYKNQAYNILIIIFVVFVSSIFFHAKIVIIDDELIINRVRFLFWIKPFIVKMNNIQKITIFRDKVPFFIISYLHNGYSTETVTVTCEKTVRFIGLRKRSENQLIIILDELGVKVYEKCGSRLLKLPRSKYVHEDKRVLRG